MDAQTNVTVRVPVDPTIRRSFWETRWILDTTGDDFMPVSRSLRVRNCFGLDHNPLPLQDRVIRRPSGRHPVQTQGQLLSAATGNMGEGKKTIGKMTENPETAGVGLRVTPFSVPKFKLRGTAEELLRQIMSGGVQDEGVKNDVGTSVKESGVWRTDGDEGQTEATESMQDVGQVKGELQCSDDAVNDGGPLDGAGSGGTPTLSVGYGLSRQVGGRTTRAL